MMRLAGMASLVTMSQEEFNMSSEYENRKSSGVPLEPDKILGENEYSNPWLVQTNTNKLWKVLYFLFFPPLLLRWWHTDRNMGVGTN